MSHKVKSEVMNEKDVVTEELEDGSHAVSKFFFKNPPHMRKSRFDKAGGVLELDEDGDLLLDRKNDKDGVILIEHSTATELKLVGLQIWRGALLLGDYILSHPEVFRDKAVLELGSGVGFDSIVAGTLAKEVVCTDVNLGGILDLIRKNFWLNRDLVKSKVFVTELDFLSDEWSPELNERVKNVEIVMAADVIYDDKITDGFVKTLARLMDLGNLEHVYVALEKRYVFTIADLDSVAPMYEEFLRCVARRGLNWSIREIELDFPQYFRYQRLKQLILMKIEKK